MDIRILLTLLYSMGVVWCYHSNIYTYHFIDTKMNWSEAQQYCRQHYTDLATFRSLEDVNQIQRPGDSWIGLFDDPASWEGVMESKANSWRWSATGTTSPGGYQNWASGQPDYRYGTHLCVLIKYGVWKDYTCSDRFWFACFTASSETGAKSFSLISTKMTWEEARSHCRQHYTDLAMIENESENAEVAALYPKVHVWTGLYRNPFRWSDGNPSTFTNWNHSEPDNYGKKQHCVLERTDYLWNDRPCSNQRSFVCHQASMQKKLSVQLKLQSAINLSDPAIHNKILQQVGAEFGRKGVTDVNLKWRRSPVQLKKPESETNMDCNSNNATSLQGF